MCGVACAPGFTVCRSGLHLGCCAFESELVAPQELGGVDPALAVDAAGKLHVAFHGVEERLTYATDQSGSWRTEPALVYWTATLGARYQIAIGTAGPLLLYTESVDSDKLHFAERRATGWSHSTVTAGRPAGFALATDRGGRAHACFTSTAAQPGVRYAVRRGDRWTITEVTADSEARGACAIAVDQQGHPHIVYYKSDAGDVVYARGDAAGRFTLSTVDSTGDVGSELAIALSADAVPHVAAYRADTFDIRHARLQGNTWIAENVGTTPFPGNPAIAVDGAGAPVITYFDSSRFRLVAVERSGDSWQTHVFQDVVNGTGSIASAPDGSIYVASGDRDVVVHHRTAAGWAAVTASAFEQTGREVSLLHRNGEPLLVYTKARASVSRVEIAARTAGAWSFAQVPGTGGGATAALDATGKLHIAYQTGLELRYAVDTGSGFSTESIGASGGSPSIAVDAAGVPHVVYVTLTGLSHGVRGPSGWTITPILTGGAFEDPILRIGPGNVLHVLWYDSTARETIYASSSDGFTKVVLQSTAGTGHDLLLTAGGVPHACFTHAPMFGSELRYGTRTGAEWSNVVVQACSDLTGCSSPAQCAIASDGAGMIAIAHNADMPGGFGLTITVLGSPNVHTLVQPGVLNPGLSLGFGAAGFEVGAAGAPPGSDQHRVRWSHR